MYMYMYVVIWWLLLLTVLCEQAVNILAISVVMRATLLTCSHLGACQLGPQCTLVQSVISHYL